MSVGSLPQRPRRLAWMLALAATVAAAPARADDGSPGPRSYNVAGTLTRSAPLAATIDGSWSIALHVLTQMVNRTWDAPYPWGTLGQYSARVLYGTSWTLMLGLEGLVYLLANDGSLRGLAEASYRSDWILSYDLPACPEPGAHGGCGVGVGGMSFIMVRPNRTRWWFEAGGGWVQQRVRNDERSTVGESYWMLSPLTATYEASVRLADRVELRTRTGPGVFFGAHMAHVHPTKRGQRAGIDPPWTEMYPLDAGLGPGARAEARLLLGDHVALGADLTLAPLLAGGPITRREPEIAPLDFARDGVSTWRRATATLGWITSRAFPMQTAVAWSATELSERPVWLAGHHSLLLRFDVPLDVVRAEGER